MTHDLVKRLRRVGEGAYVGAVSEDRKAAQEAADRIEQLLEERDEWKSRYEHHNHERLETLNLNAMQASKIGSLMNKIATLEKEIKDLRGKE